MMKRPVLDLVATTDSEECLRLYGPPANWTQVTSYEIRSDRPDPT